MITETKTRRIEPDITVVEISGRLNLGNSLMSIETSIRRLIDEGSRKLIIDLSGLDAIDSSGIGVMVSCSGLMEQAGGQMRIASAHGSVAKSFDLVHLNRLAALDPDVESAGRHLEGGAAAV